MRLIRFSTAGERWKGGPEGRWTGATPVDSPIVFLSDRWFVHLDVFRPYADTGERQRRR